MKRLLLLIVAVCATPQAFAAWAFGSAGAKATAINTDTVPLSVPYPSGISAGDTLFYITRDNNAGTTHTWSNSPTLVASSGTSHSVSIYATIATGSESGSVTVSSSSTGRIIARILRYTGGPFSLSGWVHDSQTAGSGAATGLSWPALTITHNNTLVLVVGSKNCNWTSIAGGFGTERVDDTQGTTASLVVEDQIQTTATNLSSGSWTITGDCSASKRVLAVSLEAGAATPPTFDSAPTVSSETTTAYTIGYDASANATNLYCNAYPAGTATQTAAAIEAGTGAHGTATEATTGSSDSLVVTPSDSPAYPKYDIQCALKGAGGYSAVTVLSDKFLDAPATCGGDGATQCQFITLASIAVGSPVDAFNNATSPDAIAGDILKAPTVLHPSNAALTIGTDGTFSYTSDGSRQDALNIAIYQSGGYHADDLDFWSNNQPPTAPEPGITFFVPLNSPMSPVDLAPYCLDPDGDTVTVTNTDALPTGISIVSSVLQGTSTVRGKTKGIHLSCCDITGECSDW